MGRRWCRLNFLLYLVIICLLCLIVSLLISDQCGQLGREPNSPWDKTGGNLKSASRKKVVAYDLKEKEFEYDNEAPLIFIGGVPRSGTTLMRAMLDAHPDVRCGEETRVIPRILGMRANWKRNKKEARRLEEAGIDDHVIDSAVSAFLLEVIAKHGVAAPRLCNKDPFTLKSAEYLSQLFPKAKFILMIRDGRATVHSIITRKVTITGFDLSSYRQCLEKWNQAITTMYQECFKVGQDRCMPVYYEQLVLHPEKWLRDLLKFLQLPWNNSVLHHETFVGQKVALSKTERSSDQIIKPVNTDALSKWVGQLPNDVLQDMPKIAPMLSQLGYDPLANPPEYGKADPSVLENTKLLHKNKQLWEDKVAQLLHVPTSTKAKTEP